ncbi:MAG: hypothetical protein MUF84_07535 [Anaerolineae bacterium]|nr:hypothetical protein [Anaerolineae bacterium]
MESDTSQVQRAPADEERAGTQETSRTMTAEERAAKRTQLIIVGIAVGFLVLLVAAIVLMAMSPVATTIVRDIAIVLVAVETFLIGLAMILLLFQIQVLIQVLRDEIQPLLHAVNDTASTVRGTTEFVSHNMVTPIIKLAGFSSAVGQVLSNVLGVAKATRPRKVKRSDTGTKGGNSDVQAG